MEGRRKLNTGVSEIFKSKAKARKNNEREKKKGKFNWMEVNQCDCSHPKAVAKVARNSRLCGWGRRREISGNEMKCFMKM